MRAAFRSVAVPLVLALAAPASAQPARPVPAPPHWASVEKLIAEQKLEAAAREIQQRIDAARERRDEAEWTRALIKMSQVRLGLHGHETAVRFLMEQPWPEGVVPRALLNLYHASALLSYSRQYSWEIRQRERVESSGRADLKAWTLDQIQEEIHRALSDVWSSREALGARKVHELSEYIQPNDYPPGIRDTLRDAVTYLWSDLLQDSSGWRPEHASEIFRLDLPALLRGGAGPVKLADPSVHPLVRLGAILDDLEAWHAAAGRREAALEARLERIRALHLHFTEQEDRTRIRADLTERLKAVRALPWSTVGMELEAQLWRDTGDLAAAHRVATDCAKLHPGSVGQRRCAALATDIAAPFFQVASMSVDGPRRRSISITHKNVSALHFRAYARDLVQVATRHRHGLLPEAGELIRTVQSDRPDAEWTVELPPTPDFQIHRTDSTPPLDRRGLYWIVASDRPDFAPRQSNAQVVPLLISDLVLQTSTLDRGSRNEVRVVSGSTGQPVAGAQVDLLQVSWDGKGGGGATVTRTTDRSGLVTFDRPPGDLGRFRFLALARFQGDASIEDDGLQFWRAPEPSEVAGVLVYTDRSIYRPRQPLMWKAVAYRGRRDQARFTAAAGQELTVTLHDANHQVVESKVVKTNRFGSAAGAFDIPSGRLLGAWRVSVQPPRGGGAAQAGTAVVRVEEYKRPTFEVAIQDPTSALRLNRAATLSGQARYYFGLPVVSGVARWKVVRQPVHPWWWGEWRVAPPGNPQVIATGQSPLAADGTFQLTFTAEADERAAARGVTFTYQVTADVTDEGGETRSGARSFRLGAVAVEGRIDLDRGFLVEGEGGAVLELLRTSLDGVPRPGSGRWTVRRLEMPSQAVLPADEPVPDPPLPAGPAAATPFRTPGDRLKPRFAATYSMEATLQGWKEGEAVASGTATHDERGLARAALPTLSAGAYRITYETSDELGATFSASRDLIVAGRKGVPPLPAVLLMERPSVAAGETARVLAGSGIPGQVMLFEVHRGGDRVVQRLLTSGQDSPLVELPVKAADRGGFTVSLTLVRDHQWIHLARTVHVPHDDRELKLEFATFRDLLRPGARETFRVKVSGHQGAVGTGVAEVLAYMYDRSLDFFAPHSPPGAAWLYPQRPGRPYLRSNLGQSYAGALWTPDGPPAPPAPSLTGDQLRFFEGFPMGGPGRREDVAFRSSVETRAAGRGLLEKLPEAAEPAEPDQGTVAQPAPEAPAPQVREHFAETAFFRPQLLTDRNGTVTIEFTVPDSVTAWNVYAHAVTADLRVGSVRREARSVKELMVRPYVPRFFREGDQAELKVVLNSAAPRPLAADVTLEIVEVDTGKDALELFARGGRADRRPRSVQVAGGGSASIGYPLAAPPRLGLYAFRVVARSGDLSDGELRPVPVLPSRMHLAQSRFATLKDLDRKELTFPDLQRGGDPTRIDERLVVTLDAQLAYTVLQALPYLLEYPYECTEQTLNRFVSTGVVSSLFQQYPAMARMAEALARRRDTELETFDAVDPNRKILLEETPWLVEARGGAAGDRVLKVLDPRVARAQRDESLQKLRKAQLPDGSFPWWPGGPPSPYMTLYILHGLARAAEHQVDVPGDMTQRAWGFLAAHFRAETGGDLRKLGTPFLTFLNYVASSAPDGRSLPGGLTPDERQRILDYTFEDWKRLSPYLKGLLALTLKRMGRPKDAELVFDSVMDSARTTPEQGTFWAPEDRAWLWYNDTVESHAFALRVLTELRPRDLRRDGLVQWLLINKKLSHWKSTRATAEVIYALVKYLQQEQALAIREELKVSIGRRAPITAVFEPDDFSGKKRQIVLPGESLLPADGAVVVEKSTRGFAFASATWHYSTERMPDEGRGDLLQVGRRYFRRVTQGREATLRPLAEGEPVAVGDEVEVHLSLRARHAAEYIHLRDPRGAGFEPQSTTSRHRWASGVSYYEEVRDSGASFFFDWLPAGEYTFRYRLRATMAGAFRVGPATVQSMYAPEFNAFSAGHLLSIQP
jgi:uncharacterized protein YfaS (alpha-2-macroglobulin family)